MTGVRSPCVKVCVLDVRNVCEGCGRTLDEIAAWPQADEATRRAIVVAATERRGRKEGAA